MSEEKPEEADSEAPAEEAKPKTWWQAHKYELLAPIVALFLCLAVTGTTAYLYVEYLTANLRYKVRASSDPLSHKDLIIVSIDDESLKKMGRWPWKRMVHGQFLTALASRMPKVVAWDIFFPEGSDNGIQDALYGVGMENLDKRQAWDVYIQQAWEKHYPQGADLSEYEAQFNVEAGKLTYLDKMTILSEQDLIPEPTEEQQRKLRGVVITGALSEDPIGEGGDEDAKPKETENVNAPWVVAIDQKFVASKNYGYLIEISEEEREASYSDEKFIFKKIEDEAREPAIAQFYDAPGQPSIELVAEAGVMGILPTEAVTSDGFERIIPLLRYRKIEFEGKPLSVAYPTKALEAAMRFWGLSVDEIRVNPGEAIILMTKYGPIEIYINERGEFLDSTYPIPEIAGDLSKLMTVASEAKATTKHEGFYYLPEVSKPEGERSLFPALVRMGEDVYPSSYLAVILASLEAFHDDIAWRIGGANVLTNPKSNTTRPIRLSPNGYITDRSRPFTNIKGDASQVYGFPTALYPEPELQEMGEFGFVDTEASVIDGIRRRYPLILHSGGQVYPSLALNSVMHYWDIEPEEVEIVLGKHLVLPTPDGDIKVPINEKGEYLISYRNEKTFLNIGYDRAMREALRVAINKTEWPKEVPDIKDAILLVGQNAAGLTDYGPTPFEGRSPLVRVQANVIDNILQKDFMRTVNDKPIAIALLIVMWVTLFLLKDKSFVFSIGVPLLITGAYIALCFAAFHKNMLFPLTWPIMGFAGVHLGAYYLHWKKESEQKDRIKGMFGTYLSPELVSQMVDSGDEPSLGGVDTEISAFFSDVQSFSSFSEKLTPKQLVDLMNEYLTAMTEILMEEGCYVDKYIGDAIVGIFNAPVELEGHALRGCISCMRQHKRLEELRVKWRAEGDKWPPIVGNMQARIGMNTGNATVGNMGSENRFNYTMMGDTVNLAARCESGAKAYGVYTMVTGETKEHAEKAGDDCVFRYLDKIIVKGRTQPAEMYEVVCLRVDLDEETTACLKVYEEGMELYLSQKWDDAHERFKKAAALEPNRKEKNSMAPTTPSDVMAQRALDMKANPPEKDWDGVYVMTSK